MSQVQFQQQHQQWAEFEHMSAEDKARWALKRLQEMRSKIEHNETLEKINNYVD